MSSLWKAWVDHDVDRFRRLLSPGPYNTQNTSRSPHIGSAGTGGSPGAYGTSPRNVFKTRKSTGFGASVGGARASNASLGRAEVNSRDHAGLTILLRAASSTSDTARAFVQALLDHPAIDIHVQDPESGWNALHRALYAGNISIARLLLEKERKDLTGQTVGASTSRAGRLIRTKDHEGLSPFDLYNSTIAERDLQLLQDHGDSDIASEAEDVAVDSESASASMLTGSELFAFGSNKNLTLGLGDEDDRQFPERVYLQRPDHLLESFYQEYLESTSADSSTSTLPSLEGMPTLTRYRELFVRDVVLSKYHSAILTTDPVSNLYVCGIGRGGRLGLGDENTRFTYVPVQGGLANKRVVQVALGQNHTMVVTDNGELWNFGSNANSVLGYSLPEPANKGEEPFMATPRQVFGPLKKEFIIGIAASTVHSVAHTGAALYCWGRNAGQLALMDADSRSLEVQSTPRRVAASLFSAPILMVSAIDKATTCLLANHSVIVFTAYGYNIVKFPFGETLTNFPLGNVSMSSRYDPERNRIKQIASGGETIVALTGRGDLFHMNLLAHKADAHASSSTTNPSKIKGAISQPSVIWTAHKDGVRSVDVGEHGSVIISTLSGAVWRRVKRAKAKDSFVAGAGDTKHKDFKFQRVPGITNIVAVRSSVYGAFAALRKDSDVMREQIKVGPPTLWNDLAPLNSLQDFRSSDPSSKKKDKLKFWDADRLKAQMGSVAYEVLKSPDLDTDLATYISTWHQTHEDLDAVVCTSSSPEIRIPVHGWAIAARSPLLRKVLPAVRANGSYDMPEFLNIDQNDKETVFTFSGVDIMSLLNLVLYIYEDRIIPAWNFTRQDPSLAYRYRQIRTDVIKLASKLEMGMLENAAQKQIDPQRSLNHDLQCAIEDSSFFDDADAVLNLDGDDLPVHSAMLRRRCPFFEALFHGHSQGAWLAGRRNTMDPAGLIPIDLEHIEIDTFRYVLRYLYADVGSELFDDVVCDNIDDFTDLVMDVMGAANELMLDRLSQICQQVISRFVNTRNVAHYLNAISACSMTSFKDAGLEYIALQAENFLENHLLESLDEEIISELDAVVRDNQLAHYPFARSGRAELLLHERHPDLAQDIEEERQRRVREMAFKAAQKEEEKKLSSSLKGRFGSLEDFTAMSPSLERHVSKGREERNEPLSPILRPKSRQAELMFDMDDDEGLASSPSVRPMRVSSSRKQSDLDHLPPLSGSFRDEKHKTLSRSPVSSTPGRNTPASPDLDARSATIQVGKNGSPWASAPFPTSKLDLREIMNADSPGPSALSAGIAAQKAKEASGKPQQAKISQKERKRQQQVQAEQAAKAALVAPTAKMAWDKPTTDAKSSPWKTVSSSPKTPSKDLAVEPSASAPPHTKPLVAADTSAKSFPRRTQSPDTRHSGQLRTSSTAPPVRPPPKPAAAAATTSTFSVDDPSKPIVPHSKSYIKPASKSEPTLGLSMSDIIDQEKRNRQMVKEAVAKRSLMEIQQEQAFQEWWDEELRRTQEEEARRAASQQEREEGRVRMRRGRGGKARGGRGGGNGTPAAPTARIEGVEGESSRPHGQDAGRGRGQRRGRGRGGLAKASV